MNMPPGAMLKQYEDAHAWLLSLITDPGGKRYLVEKSRETRLREYEQQVKRTAILLDFFGNPQNTYRSVHVAGTGGKGSVTMMIGTILEKAGFKVGIHTSPYLQVPNEKLLINGAMIPPSRFAQLVLEFRKGLKDFVARDPDMTPNYGEAWVVLTHLYFSQEHIDWGVIETGMGGRYDPTNVLTPEVSVITNVDLDHVPQLGTMLGEIASHKAGIIKEGKPVVTAERKPGPLAVIEQEANEKHAALFRIGKEFDVRVRSVDQKGSIVDINTPLGNYRNIPISLAGTFQPENAATALMAVAAAGQQHHIPITVSMLRKAFSSLKHPGRMEKMQDNPTVMLDGAHNPQKMSALAQSLRAIYPDRPYTLIIGMLSTKDAVSSITSILPHAHRIIATLPHVLGKPSIGSRDMATAIRSLATSKTVETAESVTEAIRRALDTASPDELIVVTGSIYMLGEARSYWFPSDRILSDAEYAHQ